MKKILETIIENLVENKEEVKVDEIKGTKSIVYEVRVADGDMGKIIGVSRYAFGRKIIGKQGKIAKSIRTVIKAIAAKENKRVSIEFIG